jgi:hypothetical protein
LRSKDSQLHKVDIIIVDCRIRDLFNGLGGGIMWTAIYIASNRVQAETLKNLLCNEGILANMRPAGVAGTQGDGMFEILVLESEATEAHAIICQHAVIK